MHPYSKIILGKNHPMRLAQDEQERKDNGQFGSGSGGGSSSSGASESHEAKAEKYAAQSRESEKGHLSAKVGSKEWHAHVANQSEALSKYHAEMAEHETKKGDKKKAAMHKRQAKSSAKIAEGHKGEASEAKE